MQKENSPKKKKTMPTLVVLSTEDHPTAYQKKRFSLKEHKIRYFPDNTENIKDISDSDDNIGLEEWDEKVDEMLQNGVDNQNNEDFNDKNGAENYTDKNINGKNGRCSPEKSKNSGIPKRRKNHQSGEDFESPIRSSRDSHKSPKPKKTYLHDDDSKISPKRKRSSESGESPKKSPRRVSKDEISPRRVSRDEISPRRVSKDEISPRRVSRDEISPRRDSKDEISPRRDSKDEEIDESKFYQDEVSSKRSNKREDVAESPKRRDGEESVTRERALKLNDDYEYNGEDLVMDDEDGYNEDEYIQNSPMQANEEDEDYIQNSPMQANEEDEDYIQNSPMQANEEDEDYIQNSPMQANKDYNDDFEDKLKLVRGGVEERVDQDFYEDENPMEEDPFDMFRSPGNLGPEVPSVATSIFSNAVDEPTMQSDFMRQMNDDKAFFARDFFKYCDEHQQRQLSRIARIQTSHKKHWILNVWSQFEKSRDIKDILFSTINITAHQSEDSKSWDNGLISSAQKELRQFIRTTCSIAPSFFIRAAIVGPKKSGKTTFLRTLTLQHLLNLTTSGIYKNTFVVNFDFAETADSLNDFYSLFKLYMLKCIEALKGQRPDVESYLPPIIKIIENFKEGGKPVIPKPLTTQNYLRRPLRELEFYLSMFHELLVRGELVEFSERLTTIPLKFASIFNFANTLIVIDHFDLCDNDIVIEDDVNYGRVKIPLILTIKKTLQCAQYIVSAVDSDLLLDELDETSEEDANLLCQTQIISVTDKCQPQSCATIKAKTKEGKKISIFPELCAGCPLFVIKYEQLIDEANKVVNEPEARKPYAKTKVCQMIQNLISTLYDTKGDKIVIVDYEMLFN